MNRTQLKYQQLFTTLLLCTYLVGNLSVPLFEGVHFLLHLGDESPLHSFQSHDTLHQHQVLNCLDELVSTSPLTNLPADNNGDKNSKKIVQQLALLNPLCLSSLLINTSNFSPPLIAYPTAFLQKNNPPPQS